MVLVFLFPDLGGGYMGEFDYVDLKFFLCIIL